MVARDTQRKEVLERYRRLRAIATMHGDRALQRLSRSHIIKTGRRLGLIHKRQVVVADSEEEVQLLMDLALYSRRSGASAIARYCRSVRAPEGSEERAVLDAMCDARFGLLTVERKHPVVDRLLRNAVNDEEAWLMDEMMEATAGPGYGLALRLIRPDDFFMTTGTPVPMHRGLLIDAFMALPPRERTDASLETMTEAVVETLYRTAIHTGVMEDVEYA